MLQSVVQLLEELLFRPSLLFWPVLFEERVLIGEVVLHVWVARHGLMIVFFLAVFIIGLRNAIGWTDSTSRSGE